MIDTGTDTEERQHGVRVTRVRDDLTDLFLAEGFATASLESMAAHARCSRSTLYAIAESKDQVIAACVEHFFRRAAQRVEARVARESDPAARVRTYLLSVATELASASGAFLRDVSARATTRGSYERHTAIAAQRIRDLISEAVADGRLDDTRARFVGEVAAVAMDAIERGGISARTGLTHAGAYAELAELVLAAVR